MDMELERKNGFFMKRSISTCLIVCGVWFFVEFGVELAVQPDNSLSHLVGVINAQTGGAGEKPEDPRPERKLQNPSQEWFLQLEKITAAVEEKDYDRARELLDRQVERTRRWNEFELAVFHRRYLDLALELDDYDLMLVHAHKILEYRDNIQYFLEEYILYLIARIYATAEYEGVNYETALEYIQQWLDLTNDWDEGSNNYVFIASVYSKLEDYYNTVEWMLRAIDKAQEEGIDVRKEWWEQLWQTYRYLVLQLMDSPAEQDEYLYKALDLSRFLVLKYIEDKGQWTKLSSDLKEIEDTSGPTDEIPSGTWAFAFEAAYHFGLLETDGDYSSLIGGMQSNEAVARAVLVFEEAFDLEIFERNFKNLNRYALLLYRSTDTEKAVVAYTEAVSFKEDATVLHTLASLHYSLDNFDQCISFADRALEATEGELRDPEQVKLIKGTCQFYNEDLDASEATMLALREEIGTDPETTVLESVREQAGQFIDLINDERTRIEYKNYVAELWREYNESKGN